MKIDGSEETKWVLVLSMSGTTGYFVGDFNGTHFTIDPTIKDIIRFDYGADFYAAISFNGIPQSKPFQQRVLIGWINNWAYANDIPTSTWRGAQSFPRALTLKKDDLFGYKVWNLPVMGIDQLIQTKILAIVQKNITGEVDIDLKGYDGRAAYIGAVMHLKDAKAIGVKVLKGIAEYTKVYLDASSQQLIVDRSKSGNVAFNENFLKIPNAVTYSKSVIRLKIIVDRSSVEVFDYESGVSITSRVFPNWTQVQE
jgi:fructan beta-fructosidase